MVEHKPQKAALDVILVQDITANWGRYKERARGEVKKSSKFPQRLTVAGEHSKGQAIPYPPQGGASRP